MPPKNRGRFRGQRPRKEHIPPPISATLAGAGRRAHRPVQNYQVKNPELLTQLLELYVYCTVRIPTRTNTLYVTDLIPDAIICGVLST